MKITVTLEVDPTDHVVRMHAAKDMKRPALDSECIEYVQNVVLRDMRGITVININKES